MKNERLVNEVVNKIKEMPENTEFCISELLKDYECDNKQLLEISSDILKKVKELNLNIKSKYGENAIVGLPYNIKYVKE